MTTFEKLAKRIKDELGVDLVDFVRTRAGVHMRCAGAPVWRAKVRGSKAEYNSDQPASELLKCKALKNSGSWSPGISCIEGK